MSASIKPEDETIKPKDESEEVVAPITPQISLQLAKEMQAERKTGLLRSFILETAWYSFICAIIPLLGLDNNNPVSVRVRGGKN